MELMKQPQSTDPEKQRLRFLVLKFRKEWMLAKAREKMATDLATQYSEMLRQHQSYINALRRTFTSRELEIVELKQAVQELNVYKQIIWQSSLHYKKCNDPNHRSKWNNLSIMLNRSCSKSNCYLQFCRRNILDKKELFTIIEQQKAQIEELKKKVNL